MDWELILAGALVGFVVGLTGMGGGALMTPVLVIFFGVQPLTAVSSDLVASLIMKPVGAAVHQRRGTVNLRLVLLLCYGSVPAAFLSVLALRYLSDPASLQSTVKVGLGVALLLAVATMLIRGLMDWRRPPQADDNDSLRPRVVPTVLIGVVGGLIVGATSVGSGSLIIVCLMLLYPGLAMSRLVGTDLVQAVPLVGAAALGHLLFGDVHFVLTGTLLIGALPAVYLGARLSASAPSGLIRRCLIVVLVLSALKLFDLSNTVLIVAAAVLVLLAVLSWLIARGPRQQNDGFGEPVPEAEDTVRSFHEGRSGRG